MPAVLPDDPVHNITILDVSGKAIEWNGEVSSYPSSSTAPSPALVPINVGVFACFPDRRAIFSLH